MRFFETNDINEIDYFSGLWVRIHGPRHIRFCFQGVAEFEKLEEKTKQWLQDQAVVTGFNPVNQTLNFYLKCDLAWRLFLDRPEMRCSAKELELVIKLLNREGFVLTGKKAFDFICLLYVELGQEVTLGGRFVFRDENRQHYQVKFIPKTKCLEIIFPNNLRGLLIGPGGVTLNRILSLIDSWGVRGISFVNAIV